MSEATSTSVVQYGQPRRRKDIPEYRVWMSMRNRCRNPRYKDYHNYGGRGIMVVARWDDFANFLADMGPRPTPGHELDRIDNDGSYEPSNCRWATRTEQARNKRTSRRLTIYGVTKTVAEWSELHHISYTTILYRIDGLGWPAEKAVTEPLQNRAEYANPRKGESHHSSRFTADTVRAIRTAVANGASMRELSRRYGVHNSAIQQIVSRKTWSHVE